MLLDGAEVRNVTRAYLARTFRVDDLADDDDMFESGLVNSLFALQLVMFVEKQFRIIVEDDDLTVENFRSIAGVARLVESKRGN